MYLCRIRPIGNSRQGGNIYIHMYIYIYIYICVCVYAEWGFMTVLCCTNTAGKSWGILIMLKEVQNIPAVRDGAHLHACTQSLLGSGLVKSSWYPVAYSLASSLARWLTTTVSHQTFYSYLKKAIVVLTLLSYTNHVLMPLDVTVCGYFKATCS